MNSEYIAMLNDSEIPIARQAVVRSGAKCRLNVHCITFKSVIAIYSSFRSEFSSLHFVK